MPDELRRQIHRAVAAHATDAYSLYSMAEIIADCIELAMNWENETTIQRGDE